jgi:hypothetical protein
MYYPDGMEEIIIKQLNKIDIEWMKIKRSEFVKNEYYDKQTDTIRIVERFLIDNTPPYEILNDEHGKLRKEFNGVDFKQEFDSSLHEFTLEQYCSSFLPIDDSTSWGSFPLEDDNQINLLTVAYELLDEIVRHFDLEKNRTIAYKILHNASIKIETLTDNEFKRNKSEDFASIAGHFLRAFNYYVVKRFSIHIEEYWNLSSQTDKLIFKLTQEEFAALFYLFSESGILPKNNANQIPYYDFIEKHFMYMRAKSPVPVGKAILRNKISDINTSSGGNGLKNIKEKLWPILKNIR